MKKRKSHRFLKFLSVILFILFILYMMFAFSDVKLFKSARSIWIETAMTTGDHQWLATAFFPKCVVNEVVEDTYIDESGAYITNTDGKSSKWDYDAKEDKFGNEIIVNDEENELQIVKIKGTGYQGFLVFIKDPSKVFVAETSHKGSRGDLITEYLENNDAILGINANGFPDINGNGSGETVLGCSMSNGVEWYKDRDVSEYTTIGFDKSDRLVVGKISNWNKYKLRDAAQFKPAIVEGGKALVSGSAGWGIHPRTIVGQKADGTVVFMIIDGRQPGYSIGITIGEAADVLVTYGVETAAACDGGSSSVLAYKGKLINSPSTPMKYGRYLPNAFLVKG